MDTTMGETEEFNTLAFEKKLLQLKDTQESIQGLSSWCLKQREHHKKIVSSWLNVLKRVKVEQRLTLFYLANDVIQYSKRKNYEFVESWGLNLQKATPLVRDEKVRPKILRILKIWEQRGVYDDEFLSDLTGLLSSGVVVKKADDDPILDFQPQQLVNKIRQCTVLESDTDLRLKQIHECPLPLNDPEALATGLKDRSNKDDVEKELNEGIQCVERYTQSLQREIVAREALLALLATANQYYSTQRGEVKVVAYAYKNFGSRVRALKRKLDDLAPSLPERGQPSPPCEEDVPSPSPDEDLDLPATDQDSQDVSYNIDRTFNTSMSADGTLYNLGLSSFLSTDPMSLFNEPTPPNDVNNANKIEVINSRPNEKQDFDINSFLKTLIPNNGEVATNDNSDSSTPVTESSLPGLGLGLPPPPPSFYGANDDPEPYQPETPTQWTPPSWSMPSLRLPLLDTPESPPPAAPIPTLPAPIPTLPAATVTMTATATGGERDYSHHGAGGGAVDVDQRGLLPPPPPPPVLPLLTGLEDVDHRLLPPLPLPPPAPRPPTPQQDVDHRNLISLTHQVRPRVPCEDQDYRALPAPPVPPVAPARLPARAPAPLPVPAPPPDIVETVDMDLSEDEEQRMFGVQPENRRNNKVLVGGNGTRPLSNPFDSMPPALSAFSQPFYQNQNQHQNYKEDDSNDSAYEEDLRSRSLLPNPEHSTEQDGEWRDMFNPRFQSPNPRNWGPRSRGPAPWRPRGPQRWPGPRSQPRFW